MDLGSLHWNIKAFDNFNTKELYNCLQLRTEVFVLGQNCVYQDMDGLDWQAIHICGYFHQKLIAYCRIFEPGLVEPNACNFGRVLVAPAYRRQGVGRLLMEQTMDYLREQWPKENTVIHAQKYLEAFYQSLGFTTCSATYLEVGIPHIKMIRANDSK